uniref:Uncharacterized protein n=1 Tax=Arundo donax TaxID=35708 RepID=A0A0A9D0X6_ARUDO
MSSVTCSTKCRSHRDPASTSAPTPPCCTRCPGRMGPSWPRIITLLEEHPGDVLGVVTPPPPPPAPAKNPSASSSILEMDQLGLSILMTTGMQR